MEKEELLKVRPKLSIGFYFLRNTWMFITAIVLIILTFIFYGFSLAISAEIAEIGKSFMKILRILIICIVPFVYLYQTLKMYLHTRKISYTFYDDFVRYEDNFLNLESKDIKYENITEVSMYQNVWDRVMKTGNIHLKTNVEYNVGMYMPFVINPKETVEEIRKIIGRENNEQVD